MSLSEATNRAADFGKSKDFVAAINTCYESFYKDYFSDDTAREAPKVIERFLTEYIDACVRATQEQRLGRVLENRYFERVLSLSDKYFTLLDGEKPSRERSQAVISDLIFASIKLGRQEDLLATLEDITGTYFESFRPSLMNEWERLLRSAENYQRELNNLEIQNRLRSDKNYADHWKAYEDFLRQVATLPLMKAEARRRLSRVPKGITA